MGPLSVDAEQEPTTTLFDRLKESRLDFFDPPPSKSDLAATGQKSPSDCLVNLVLLAVMAGIIMLLLP